MSETKHTPGPWYSDTSGEYYAGHVVRHNGVLICRMATPINARAGKVAANARLLAAAPELLAALEAILDGRDLTEPPKAMTQAHRHWVLLDKARAAIAKARGE